MGAKARCQESVELPSARGKKPFLPCSGQHSEGTDGRQADPAGKSATIKIVQQDTLGVQLVGEGEDFCLSLIKIRQEDLNQRPICHRPSL